MPEIFNSETEKSTRRTVFLVAVAVVAMIFVGRLAQLQIIKGTEYRLQADAQGIKRVTIEPVRGALFDRNGFIIVSSEGSHTIYITPNKIDERSKLLLGEILRVDTSEINNRIEKYWINEYTPIRIYRDVNDTAWAKLNEFYTEFNGVELENESKRYYDDNLSAAHILGYVREIDKDELEISEYYVPGDMIGKQGIEKAYEPFLRGEKGFEFVAVNNRGQRIESFADGKNDIRPTNGFDLYLGLDAEVQSYAEYLYEKNDYTGGIVAIEPSTGEIIAMASYPTYDPEIFNGVMDSADLAAYRAIQKDEDNPQMNRATHGVYPPGSTWKPLMALAALEEGLIEPDTRLTCPGAFVFGGRSWACHGAHGSVEVVRAIQASCNVFFYKLGLEMGIDRYHEWGSKFGFGTKLDVDVPEASWTRLPSRAYYDNAFGKDKWPRGVMVNLGIGQGELAVNPLQLAAYTAAIANDGIWIQPHFVSSVKNKLLGSLEKVTGHEMRDLGIAEENLRLVQRGMYAVVNEPGGTAGHVSLERKFGIHVAGKTGTAQNPHGKDHSWFIAYAPVENPQIAMAVLVENRGFGSTHAAPIARKLIQFYLTRVVEEGDEWKPFLERESPPPTTTQLR